MVGITNRAHITPRIRLAVEIKVNTHQGYPIITWPISICPSQTHPSNPNQHPQDAQAHHQRPLRRAPHHPRRSSRRRRRTRRHRHRTHPRTARRARRHLIIIPAPAPALAPARDLAVVARVPAEPFLAAARPVPEDAEGGEVVGSGGGVAQRAGVVGAALPVAARRVALARPAAGRVVEGGAVGRGAEAVERLAAGAAVAFVAAAEAGEGGSLVVEEEEGGGG